MLRKLIKAIISAFQNLIRHGLLSFTTITIMTMTLVSITMVAMSNIVIQDALDLVEDKLNISIELYDGLSEDQILQFKTELEKQDIIKAVEYISKEDALQSFKERFEDKESIITFIDSLGYNPLYATFSITTENSEDYETLKEFLQLPTFKYLIKEIKDQANQTERINTFRNINKNITSIGSLVGILFGIIAILIIFNTIKMGIHHRKNEIKIMKLVGASYTYITLPFIIEGILYGLLGMLFTVIIISSLFISLKSSSIPLVQFINNSLETFYKDHSLQIVVGQILLASLLGILSSYAAIFSYLRKKSQ